MQIEYPHGVDSVTDVCNSEIFYMYVNYYLKITFYGNASLNFRFSIETIFGINIHFHSLLS